MNFQYVAPPKPNDTSAFIKYVQQLQHVYQNYRSPEDAKIIRTQDGFHVRQCGRTVLCCLLMLHEAEELYNQQEKKAQVAYQDHHNWVTSFNKDGNADRRRYMSSIIMLIWRYHPDFALIRQQTHLNLSGSGIQILSLRDSCLGENIIWSLFPY